MMYPVNLAVVSTVSQSYCIFYIYIYIFARHFIDIIPMNKVSSLCCLFPLDIQNGTAETWEHSDLATFNFKIIQIIKANMSFLIYKNIFSNVY